MGDEELNISVPSVSISINAGESLSSEAEANPPGSGLGVPGVN